MFVWGKWLVGATVCVCSCVCVCVCVCFFLFQSFVLTLTHSEEAPFEVTVTPQLIATRLHHSSCHAQLVAFCALAVRESAHVDFCTTLPLALRAAARRLHEESRLLAGANRSRATSGLPRMGPGFSPTAPHDSSREEEHVWILFRPCSPLTEHLTQARSTRMEVTLADGGVSCAGGDVVSTVATAYLATPREEKVLTLPCHVS